jgi:glycosyltransferase involved in cell wall biosynthesis
MTSSDSSGPPLHPVILSDLEALGGAGLAASRLSYALAAEGMKVTRLYNNPDKSPYGEPITWESVYAGLPRGLEVGVNGLKRLTPGLARTIGRAWSRFALERAIGRLEFDVLHVHAIANCYWDHSALGALDPELPVVWTFHDNWSFAAESQVFLDAAGRSVRLKPDGADRDAAIARRVAYFRSRRRLVLAGNSRYTARTAEQILGLPVQVVPIGIPLHHYAPIDKRVARQALRLPEDAFIVGFIADNRSEPVKGFDVVRRALEGLGRPGPGPGVVALAIGAGRGGEERLGEVAMRLVSRVTQPELLAILYNAADVFIVPSLAEGLPQVGIESVSCGTPVIGSDVGGVPDVVNERTGWLFPPGDAGALRAILARLAAEPTQARALAASCRAFAEEHWGLRTQALRYQGIYRELLAR